MKDRLHFPHFGPCLAFLMPQLVQSFLYANYSFVLYNTAHSKRGAVAGGHRENSVSVAAFQFGFRFWFEFEFEAPRHLLTHKMHVASDQQLDE